MKRDIKSNFTLAEHFRAASHAIGTPDGTAVDCSAGASIAFTGSIGSVGTGGTLALKVQYSDDDSTYHDETDTAYGNATTASYTAVGEIELHVPNPHARYYRLHATVATDAVIFGVNSILGPLNSVGP